MIEMMVAVSIFAMIFGLAGMLYVQSTFRAANAMEINKLTGEVRDLDHWLETTIQNATSVTTASRSGLTGLSATALVFTMPANGSAYDQFGLFNAYTPASCSSGTVHWGTGVNRWLYFSDSGGTWSNGGSYLWTAEKNGSSPGNNSMVTAFTFYNSNSNIYNWSLIDSLTFTVNTSNNTVTYTIHASDLTQTGQVLGSSQDTADSHTLQITRTVYWRHSVT